MKTSVTELGDSRVRVDVGIEPQAVEQRVGGAVRPKAKLGEYAGIEVGRVEPEVPEEAVRAELDRLREGFASLNPVERPAAPGDLAVIDYSGTADGEPFEGAEATDLMVE